MGFHPHRNLNSIYWRVLKNRLKKEGNETVTNCHDLKMTAAGGKMRMTDVADQEQLFRLIQSILTPCRRRQRNRDGVAYQMDGDSKSILRDFVRAIISLLCGRSIFRSRRFRCRWPSVQEGECLSLHVAGGSEWWDTRAFGYMNIVM